MFFAWSSGHSAWNALKSRSSFTSFSFFFSPQSYDVIEHWRHRTSIKSLIGRNRMTSNRMFCCTSGQFDVSGRSWFPSLLWFCPERVCLMITDSFSLLTIFVRFRSYKLADKYLVAFQETGCKRRCDVTEHSVKRQRYSNGRDVITNCRETTTEWR